MRKLYAIVIGAFLLLLGPGLGTAGLFDPWETHYAQVSREILKSGDWIRLTWEGKTFLSKPPLAMWLGAASSALFGENAWALRLPSLLASLACLLAMLILGRRALGGRAAVWAAVAMATTPLFLGFSRLLMCDTHMVAGATVAAMVFLVAASGERLGLRLALLAGASAGYAVLGKGLFGLGIPVAALGVYALLSRDFAVIRRVRPLWFTLAFLIVVLPWHVAMALREPKPFWNEYILEHHFYRLVTGVHGIRSTFDYYLREGGFGIFPWVAALPGALAALILGPSPREAGSTEARIRWFVLSWILVVFIVITAAATKFHHYVFPIIPPLGIAIGLWLTKFEKSEMSAGDRLLSILGLVLLGLVGQDLLQFPRNLMNLFLYQYDRYIPIVAWPRAALGLVLILAAAGTIWGFVKGGIRHGRYLVAASALLFSIWFLHGNWPLAGRTLSERDGFDHYWKEKRPGDRVVRTMNWRGDVYYGGGKVPQLNGDKLKAALKGPGRVFIASLDQAWRTQQSRIQSWTGVRPRLLWPPSQRYAMLLWDPKGKDPAWSFEVKEVPADARPFDVRLGNQLRLRGLDLIDSPIYSGATLIAALYFQVLRPLDRDWKIFLHADRTGFFGGSTRIKADVTAGDGIFPTSRWKPGTLIRQVIYVEVPKEHPAGAYDLYAGLFDAKGERMKVSPKEAADSENRIRLGDLEVYMGIKAGIQSTVP